ncbi:YceD family protein [Saccharopolyspora sp. NPDC047091]|uniref:YceD family protein n=1 Tax=Saccharopolyspora sp. NPDC047091 TaxID=3155924 RepID=UPI0033FDCE0C
MSQNRDAASAAPQVGPWVIDTRELGHRAGSSRSFDRSAPAPAGFGLEMIGVPEGDPVQLDVLAESVVEGVLISGTATAEFTGECARCLDQFSEEIEIELRELYAYPDSTTEATTDEDEVSRVVDDLIDLEPAVRDAMLLTMPTSPVCSEDCEGLCTGCGVKWAELGSDHTHETMDPRWAALRERFGGNEEEN